jgi:tetratricopeptide (TPR) repeat protein
LKRPKPRTAPNATRRVGVDARGPKRVSETGHRLGLRSGIWIYLALLAAVFLTYGRVLHFDFISFDDPVYVTENQHVQTGLSWAGVAWAFGSSVAGNWHPLTWLSLMLDYQLFGLDGGWYHFTNVCIHALSAALLFTVLTRITGSRWKSGMVAFLFALHPLQVESVAWVCERKDVLSALFWMLTLWAYAGYASQPGRGRYTLTLFLFCLGLMAKPMLVTLPIVLLLLDRWPLQRGIRIIEKLPFFAASIAVSVVTYLVQRGGGAVVSFEQVPVSVRFENALVSYAAYLLKMVWPVNLAVFYPYSRGPLLGPAVIVGIAICATTFLVIRVLPRRPYLAIGWLWYLVTLLPVIGLIQVGAQARADRYTYIPMIGVGIALVWGVSETLDAWPRVRLGMATAACSVCLVLTWHQVSYWRDSISVYQHAIDVTSYNYLARFNLASVLEARGNPAGAVAQLRETLRIQPYFASAHAELGQLLAKQGQPEEALKELQSAVRLEPENADPHLRLGSVLGSLGRAADAAVEFSEGLRLQPDNADGHYNFGIALAQEGKLKDAAREFRATVKLRPTDVEAHFNLGIALAELGQTDESIAQLSEAVRIKPEFTEARRALEDLIGQKGRLGKQ